MKVGIFFSGLGEAFHNGSAMRYAERLKNEMDYNNDDTSVTYRIQQEKLEYIDQCDTNCVTIYEMKAGNESMQYRLYDFYYSDLLTKEFKERNVLVKSCYLLLMVITKLPTMLWRLFVKNKDGYQSFKLRIQAMYVFIIFLAISLWGLFLLPSVLTLVTGILSDMNSSGMAKEVVRFLKENKTFSQVSMSLVSFSAILYTLAPSSKALLDVLATEFTCANYYLQLGDKRDSILGNLDRLIEFIAEREQRTLPAGEEFKLHLHAYSFGSVLVLDALFPYNGARASRRLHRSLEMICTIGCPYEFIATYYNSYFQQRTLEIAGNTNVKWLNVYMMEDALSSNFRDDDKYGEATYGISPTFIPQNLPYKHVMVSRFNPFNFVMLNSLKMHQYYWDKSSSGQNCLRVIYNKMKEDNYI